MSEHSTENDAPVYGTAPVPDYFVGTEAEWAVLRRAQEAEARVIPPASSTPEEA